MTERDQHIFAADSVRLLEKRFPELELLMHIPNGEKRDKRTAAKLKRMLVRPGVPDFCLPLARGGHSSLWIELKDKGGRLSKEQKEMHERLRGRGALVAVCYSGEEVLREIFNYLQQSGELRHERGYIWKSRAHLHKKK